MIRYVVSFPAEADMRPEQMHHLQRMLKECADDRQWRDLVINQGGTITDMRPGRSPKPVWVKNVQRRLR